MKCLNCGHMTAEYLCPDCRTEEVLDRLIPQMGWYKAEKCEFPYLMEYAATLPEGQEVRKCIPNILELLSKDLAEYYRCLYYRYEEKDKLEATIEAYLTNHDWSEVRSQKLIDCLLYHYDLNDFAKPRVWCD